MDVLYIYIYINNELCWFFFFPLYFLLGFVKLTQPPSSIYNNCIGTHQSHDLKFFCFYGLGKGLIMGVFNFA